MGAVLVPDLPLSLHDAVVSPIHVLQHVYGQHI
jgi:hypothetical protein